MNKFFKTTLSLSLLFTLNADEGESDTQMLNDFESLINDVSQLATKQSLNVDYLPGVVTVIQAETFLNTGIQNIFQALEMLPGIQMQLSPMGYAMTNVRGFKNPNAYISDKIKIYVDGVAINNEVTGSSNFYMDFPMQLVEKIEVLRGPASTTHGAGAFYGTVNIITKLGNSTKEKRFYAALGSYKYKTAGANFYTKIGSWDIFSDGYYQENDKHIFVPEVGKSTDEALQDLSVGMKATNGGFEFLTRFKHNISGNFYSYEGIVDPTQEQEHINSYFFSQLSYMSEFNDFALETKASFSHREFSAGANMYDGTIARFEKVQIAVADDIFRTEENSHEQNIEIATILTLPTIVSNDIILGASAKDSRVTYDRFYSNVENYIAENKNAIVAHKNYDDFRYNATQEPAYWDNPTSTLLKEDLKRDVASFYIQDLITITEKVDLNLAVRADYYSDFKLKVSKRAGLIYRADEEMIFKLLYGSAFRMPTFTEAYSNGHINYRAGDTNLLPEETNTYEAVAIYLPNLNNKISLNLFYSQLNNVIDLEEFEKTIAGYQNYNKRVSKGAEFEYFYHPKVSHNLYLNASYIDSDYLIPPEKDSASVTQSMPDISQMMFKAMYLFQFDKKLSFGTALRAYSETTQTELEWVSQDGEATVSSYYVIDETVTYKFTPMSEGRITLKNLLNANERYPSYYYGIDNGIQRESSNFFVSYIQKF